ncbi:MAG: ABC transporter ATP-binding protein [Actinomycetes bacterium]
MVANDRVDVDLRRGEVHAFLGENGAGKSTLAAVLCGLYVPEEGELLIDGERTVLHSPRDGLARGIGMVHQHFRLVDRFTVAENVVLGDRRQPFRLRRGSMDDTVAAIAERYGLPLDPRAHVGDLSVGQRQRVEIVKTLHQGAEVLLLDEPTSVLTPQEADALFATVRAMTADGKAVVFISHKLGEVLEIADRITVMRDGRVTGDVAVAATSREELARMMVGRDVDLSARRATAAAGAPVLRVEDLTLTRGGSTPVDRVSLEVRAGEIVGIAGVSGNGQRELADLIAGVEPPTAGTIRVGEADVTGRGPRAARAAGLAYVPEDRLGTGLAPGLSMVDNMLLTRPRGFILDRRAARAEAARIIDRFEVKTTGPDAPAGLMSGGNAQKVLIARELDSTDGEHTARVLVAASPTRGLDVGAIETVWGILDRARDRGEAIVLISEDLEEVLAISDRVLVLFEGRIVHETSAADASREAIGLAMAGATA